MSRAFKFAHIADAHVGAWPRDPALRSALRASVERALAAVLAEKCEFLVIAGDLFHTPVPDPSEAAPIAAALRRLNDAGVRIYAIFGSHDYVARRTSWLDVLAEGGLYIRVAPESVRQEGESWALPYVKDEATGTLLAGVSGRATGLDRKAYEDMDAGAFEQERGFKVFMFHAAVEDYLPEYFRSKVPGVKVAQLPKGCGYYAGGHIHMSYAGKGPGGGPLVNPGAVFGTSITDLSNVANGSTKAGLVVVDVKDGLATPRWVVTTESQSVRVPEVDVTGLDPTEALDLIRHEVGTPEAGVLLLPKIHGTLASGQPQQLDLRGFAHELEADGAASVRLDTRDLSGPTLTPVGVVTGESESDSLKTLVTSILTGPGTPASLVGPDGVPKVLALMRDLGVPRGEGESADDYRSRVVGQALRTLGLEPGSAATTPSVAPGSSPSPGRTRRSRPLTEG